TSGFAAQTDGCAICAAAPMTSREESNRQKREREDMMLRRGNIKTSGKSRMTQLIWESIALSWTQRAEVKARARLRNRINERLYCLWLPPALEMRPDIRPGIESLALADENRNLLFQGV